MVEAIIAAGVGVASTVANISDMKKRREFEANLAMLTNDQRQALEQQVAKESNQTARMNIIVNSILTMRQSAAERQRKIEQTKLIVIASVGVVSLGMIAWFLKG